MVFRVWPLALAGFIAVAACTSSTGIQPRVPSFRIDVTGSQAGVDRTAAPCYWEANQLKAQFRGDVDSKGEHVDVGFDLGPSPLAGVGSFDLMANASNSFAFVFQVTFYGSDEWTSRSGSVHVIRLDSALAEGSIVSDFDPVPATQPFQRG